MDDANHLPNDLEECHRLLLAAFKQSMQLEEQAQRAEQRAAVSEQEAAELTRVLDATAASYESLQQQYMATLEEHAATLEELAWYKRWAYGRRRERFVEGEGQGHLFELDPPTTEPSAESASIAEVETDIAVAPHKRRKKRPIDWDKLPKIEHRHDLLPDERKCACCGGMMTCIGEDVTRELEYQPAKLEGHIHICPKYACSRCKDGVTTAERPPRPIPGGIAGPGLIAEVVVSKFGDHLPLYRLEDILTRSGVYLARSTLCDWVRFAAELLRPLYELQRQRVLQSSVMWTDDTRIRVLGGSKGSFQGYFWTYLGDDHHPYAVYDFTPNRTRAGPMKFLENYSGYLHADAYTGYDAMFIDVGRDVHEVACWSHARRKFFDSTSGNPREAHQVLEWIWQLSDIEDRGRELSIEARRELRQREANPVLDKIEVYLEQLKATLLPKANLTQAVNYARNQWRALRRYTEDGRLTMDNNVSERTLRQQAIGRKNYLFLGSEAAGPRAAVLYTILAGAKRHRIEPWAYVRDLLLRLHADDTKVEDMLPDRWAAAHPEAILTHRLEESRQKAARQSDRRKRRRALKKRPSK